MPAPWDAIGPPPGEDACLVNPGKGGASPSPSVEINPGKGGAPPSPNVEITGGRGGAPAITLDDVRRCAEEVLDTVSGIQEAQEGVRVAEEALERAEADAASARRALSSAITAMGWCEGKGLEKLAKLIAGGS